VNITAASMSGNTLNIKFSATESPDIAGIDVASIKPTVLVGLYGYNTKDFIIGPHERLTDDNNDNVIDNKDSRALEAAVGAEHPRIKTVSAANGQWEVTADLSAWADMIADNITRRLEIGVLPTLKNADNVTLAINAPSRTFDIKANAFDDKFYGPIVKVTDGCNNCHDALATTFHQPDRGGNVVVCRLCHTPKSGGSHLEVQSRSIDSYVHAIHRGQGFDIGDIDFADPVQALHYEDHVTFPFPTHDIKNCEACHVAGKYNVPDQSKSLPGILSATDPVESIDRRISDIPAYVTGPASRACGGCHRAVLIKEDDANGLLSFLQHTKNGGYLIPDGTEGKSVDELLQSVIDTILGNFE
jgi:OmcA/MtrC family decaheme c-type cytochrome